MFILFLSETGSRHVTGRKQTSKRALFGVCSQDQLPKGLGVFLKSSIHALNFTRNWTNWHDKFINLQHEPYHNYLRKKNLDSKTSGILHIILTTFKSPLIYTPLRWYIYIFSFSLKTKKWLPLFILQLQLFLAFLQYELN